MYCVCAAALMAALGQHSLGPMKSTLSESNVHDWS
jgi:hypothetical protein